MSTIQELGVQFIQYLQTFHPELDGVMGFFAILVKPEYFMVFILPVLYWNFGNRFFIKLFIVVIIDILIGEILRIGLAQPRPWWIAEMVPIDDVTSVYSSPAGYSSFSTLFFGFVAYHFRKKWVTFICVFIIIATSIAKLYEAATLIDHLLLGIIQGLLMLWLFVKKGDKITDWIISLTKSRVLLLTLGLAILFYVLTYLITLLQLTYDLPASMIKYRIIPGERLSNGATVFTAGFLISGILSLKLNAYNHKHLKVELALWKRILGTILGLGGVFVLFTVIRPTLINLFSNEIIVGCINLLFAVLTGFWIYNYVPSILYKRKSD